MEDTYSCSSCPKTFENIDDFSEHLGSHIEEEATSKTTDPSTVSNTNVKFPSKVLFPSGHDARNSNMTFGDFGSNLVLETVYNGKQFDTRTVKEKHTEVGQDYKFKYSNNLDSKLTLEHPTGCTTQYPNLTPGSQWFDLPDGWRKNVLHERGYTYISLTPPNTKTLKSKILRSNQDILSWVQNNPNSPINTMYVNMLLPFDKNTGETFAPAKLNQELNKLRASIGPGESVQFDIRPIEKNGVQECSSSKTIPQKLLGEPKKINHNVNAGSKWFNLPGGWRKNVFISQKGRTHVTLYPPSNYPFDAQSKPNQAMLKSTEDIIGWARMYPNVPIDTKFVNMLVPIHEKTGETTLAAELNQKLNELRARPEDKLMSSGSKWFNLPDGWQKNVYTSQAGNRTVTLYPPNQGQSKQRQALLKSNEGILRWAQRNPDAPINTRFVNMLLPIDENTGETVLAEVLDQQLNNLRANLSDDTGKILTVFRQQLASGQIDEALSTYVMNKDLGTLITKEELAKMTGGKTEMRVTLYPPGDSEALGSNEEILRWVQKNPLAPVNTMFVNMLIPFNQVTGETEFPIELTQQVVKYKKAGQVIAQNSAFVNNIMSRIHDQNIDLPTELRENINEDQLGLNNNKVSIPYQPEKPKLIRTETSRNLTLSMRSEAKNDTLKEGAPDLEKSSSNGIDQFSQGLTITNQSLMSKHVLKDLSSDIVNKSMSRIHDQYIALPSELTRNLYEDQLVANNAMASIPNQYKEHFFKTESETSTNLIISEATCDSIEERAPDLEKYDNGANKFSRQSLMSNQELQDLRNLKTITQDSVEEGDDVADKKVYVKVSDWEMCEDAEPSNTIQREDHRPKTCPCTDQCEIKPNCSYSSLIVMAIQSSQEGKMSLNMIYDFISKKFPYYGHMQDKSGWQASIRHNLSVHKKLFVHETRDRSSLDPHCRHRQGGFWSLSPNADVDKIILLF